MNASQAATLDVGAHAIAPNEATHRAQQDTVLNPRFYTTDFDAMDRLNIESVRPQWDLQQWHWQAGAIP